MLCCVHTSLLTGGVTLPRPSGFVPDGQAVLQEAEVPRLLPRAGLDFSQSRPRHHDLDMGGVPDICARGWGRVNSLNKL